MRNVLEYIKVINMLKLVIDAMGSDNGSSIVKDAVREFKKNNPDVSLTVVGKENELEDIKDISTVVNAEDVVPMTAGALEVMRMKYVSVMNDRYEGKLISYDEYESAMSVAEEVEIFKPVYQSIFRSWALNEESEYGMTLEELTKATIENTTKIAAPVEYANSLSKMDILTISIFAGLSAIAGAIYISNYLSNKRRGYAA